MSSGRWRGPGWRWFDADPACGKAVRDWIARVVGAHGCPVDAPDAALVVSELFGNAVRHGPDAGNVLVAYLLWRDGARIVVCDRGGPTLPRLRDRDSCAEGGRGLQVVDALAACWGSFRAAHVQVVWCDLGQPLPATSAHAVAFTGHPYRAGPELSIDGRPTVTRHLSGQPGPTATADAAGEQLIATLTDLAGLAGSAQHIAVVSGQPEFSKQDAAEAVTRWQRSQRSNGGRSSIDVYGHDWTLHR